ncbi:hypothetical protein [Bifidobacterium crudilactis]|jgi:hypothetical protein|uniref:hypothetical protein n=1 Tax=Bifidobacterium crudilactis TaxID=327277 RepID=UPI002F358FEB
MVTSSFDDVDGASDAVIGTKRLDELRQESNRHVKSVLDAVKDLNTAVAKANSVPAVAISQVNTTGIEDAQKSLNTVFDETKDKLVTWDDTHAADMSSVVDGLRALHDAAGIMGSQHAHGGIGSYTNGSKTSTQLCNTNTRIANALNGQQELLAQYRWTQASSTLSTAHVWYKKVKNLQKYGIHTAEGVNLFNKIQRGTVYGRSLFSKTGAHASDFKLLKATGLDSNKTINKFLSKLPSTKHGQIANDLSISRIGRGLKKVSGSKVLKGIGWAGTALSVTSDVADLRGKGYSTTQTATLAATHLAVNTASSAAGGAAGRAAGGWVGGLLGTVLIPIPGVGTAVGAAVGSWLGGIGGSWAGGWIGDQINNAIDGHVKPRNR